MSHFDIVTEVDYSPVVQRLLEETEFWGREALIKLVENGLFPSRYVRVHTRQIYILVPNVLQNLALLENVWRQLYRKGTGYVCFFVEMLEYWNFFLQGITSVLLQHCCDCVPEAVVVKLLEAVIKLVKCWCTCGL